MKQAAEYLGVHESAVRQAVQSGRLPHVEQFEIKLIKRGDLDEYRARTSKTGRRGPAPSRFQPTTTGEGSVKQ